MSISRQEKNRLLRSFLKSSLPFFAACILFSAAAALLEMVVPQIIRYSVDSVIGDAPLVLPTLLLSAVERLGGVAALRRHMWLLAALIAVMGVLTGVMRYFSHVFTARAGETLVKTMRDRLYAHIQQLPWSWHQNNATGDIIQRCTSDVEVVKNFFQDQFVSVFRIAVLLLFSLYCMARMSWQLSLVALIFIPIIVTYSYIFHKKVRRRFTICDENEGLLSTIAQENLTGTRVVKAFGREAYERDRFEKQNQVYTDSWVQLCHTLAWFWAAGDLSSGLQVMLIIVVGCIFCVQGRLTPGEFIAFNSYNAMLIYPVRQLGRMISEMSKTGVSVDRIAYILHSPAERDAPDAGEAPMDGDIVFEDVSFRYENGPEVLSHLSFTIPAHSSFGILGGTGSGKSSLVHLLCRLYEPEEGRITVGGTALSALKARYVRSQVGIVLQEPFLFSRTIGENIGLCGASAEEVRAAAVTAYIDGDISGFAAGYDTAVGERGVTLSGGQKQRVAIARTLTRNTPVLIFDDSLSAVDTETDEHIRTALKNDRGGATTIIISHRITTLADCDYILVLDRGRLAELGTPEELYQRGGTYRRIYDMQMSLGDEEAGS